MYGSRQQKTNGMCAVVQDGLILHARHLSSTGGYETSALGTMRVEHKIFSVYRDLLVVNRGHLVLKIRGCRYDGSRDHCEKRLRLSEMTPSGIVTAMSAGTVRVTETPQQQQKGRRKGIVGDPTTAYYFFYWNCRRRKSVGIAYRYGLLE